MITVPTSNTLDRQVPVNWLNAAITVIDTISEATAFLRGLDMDSEYVPLLALCLLAGGVIFWLFLIGAILLGGCRLVRRGFWAVIDLLPAKGDGGSLPHVE